MYGHVTVQISPRQLVGGKPHGRGVAVYNDGKRYEGDWKDGFFHGKGKLIYADESFYDGEFNEGGMEGEGVFGA
jgi:hypothetical protein